MNRKKVYLTIDDAPSKDFRGKVDFLFEKGIPVVFFGLGEYILKHEEEVIYAIKKGFIFGNHSFTHRAFSSLSIAECKEEIQKTHDIIERLYASAGVERKHYLFRFPYIDLGGDANTPKGKERQTEIQNFLKELGYAQGDFKGIDMNIVRDKELLKKIDVRCTFDQMEYWLGVEDAPFDMSKEENILNRIEENSPENGCGLNSPEFTDIILLHDHEVTTDLFYRIVNRYIEKGIEFLSLK